MQAVCRAVGVHVTHAYFGISKGVGGLQVLHKLVSTRGSLVVQVGQYKPAQRLATVAYRGAQFFGVSFAASMFGHSLTKYVVSKAEWHCDVLEPQRCTTHVAAFWCGLLRASSYHDFARIRDSMAVCIAIFFNVKSVPQSRPYCMSSEYH